MLYNVYVKTALLYGCAVWGSSLLRGDGSAVGDYTGKFGSTYRSALRAILGVSNEVRNELVYVLTCQWPLQLYIAKATLRYVAGLEKYPRLVS